MRTPLIFLTLLLASCAQPGAAGPADAPATSAPSGPLNRAQAWSYCQDANRGLAAATACTALIEAGQETRQGLISAHYNRAMALGRRGRTQAAIADYDTILQQDPAFALALYQRGLLLQSMGQQIRADQDLMRAHQLDPRLH